MEHTQTEIVLTKMPKKTNVDKLWVLDNIERTVFKKTVWKHAIVKTQVKGTSNREPFM